MIIQIRSFELELHRSMLFFRLPLIGQGCLSKCPAVGWEWTFDRAS